MKKLKILAAIALTVPFLVSPFAALAGDTNLATASKPVPYPLDTCIISGDKLGGNMGPPIVFVYSNKDVNQEIKFCCPMCKPKFLAAPDKYMKTIKEAEAKAKN
jgi:hypothetical protein